MIDNTLDLDALKRNAATAMAEATDLDFREAHDFISYFLGDIKEGELFNIIINKEELAARQVKAANILKNLKKLKAIDIAEGVGTLGGTIYSQAGGDFVMAAILAGVFLVRTGKKLLNVPLKKKHALVILGLHNNPVNFNNSAPLLDYINTEYKSHPDVTLPMDDKELKVILADLHMLGIVNLADEPMVLKDKVALQ